MEKQSDGTKNAADIIIRNTIENVSKLDEEEKSWTHDCMFDLRWEIRVQIVLVDNTKYLQSFFRPTSSDLRKWSYQASAEFRLLSHKAKQEPLTTNMETFFDDKDTTFACLCAIPMQQVSDPKNGYIQNDAIKLEVHINLESMFPLTEDEKKITCVVNQPDLTKNYRKMYEEKLFADFVVRTHDQEFKVHKAVLAACSPVFKAMVLSEMIEKTEGHVTIDDFSADVVEQLLQFLYTSKIDTDFDNFIDLYVAAEKYDLPELQKICEHRIMSNISCSDAVDILIHSKQHNRLKLKRYAVAFILNHAKEIVKLSEFELMCENHVDLAMIIMRHMSVFTPIYRIKTRSTW